MVLVMDSIPEKDMACVAEKPSSNATVAAATSIPNEGVAKVDDWVPKLGEAESYKAKGNNKYKQKEFMKAIGQYHRALMYLKGINALQHSPFVGILQEAKEVPEEVQERVNQLTADCYNNLAACLLQMESPSYSRILEYCNKTIELSPTNMKALFRKGVALYNLKKPEEALVVFKQARNLPEGKNDTSIGKYMKLCDEEIACQDEKMRNRCKAMFSTSQTSSESA